MKTFIKSMLAVLAVLVMLTGCAGMQSSLKSGVVKHEVELVITSNEPVTVEEIPKYELPENPSLELSGLTRLSKDKAFTSIFSGLSVTDVKYLWNDITYIMEMTDIREMELFINSPGGDAFQGLALADQLERAQQNGLTVTAHASGIVASAAVPAFAVCEYRMAAPGTLFMVHEAALWKWPGRETSSDIRAQSELMIQLQDQYLGYLVRNSKLSLEQWVEKEQATTWFNAKKAQEWGLVDKIE